MLLRNSTFYRLARGLKNLGVIHGPHIRYSYVNNFASRYLNYPIKVTDVNILEFHTLSSEDESYKEANVILMVFSVDEFDSFDRVREFLPAVKEEFPSTPLFLVGTDIDQRYHVKTSHKLLLSHEADPIKPSMGHKLAREIGAIQYLEYCWKSSRGIYNVFHEVVYAAIHYKKQTKQRKKERKIKR